jgi:hypothetical protein
MITELLGAAEPLFSMAIKQLEDITGKPGIDVRLSVEIISRVKAKTKELGLDPADTTGEELYRALMARIQKDDNQIAEMLGCDNPKNPKKLMSLIVDKVNRAKIHKKCWVLKKSVAKEMLRQNPPAEIMKHLKYKSIDSMLKNENIIELYGALRIAQSPAWLNKFNKQYKKIIPSEFEERQIEIYQMPYGRWADISEDFIVKKMHNVTHLKELGAIVLLPIKDNETPGLAITIMPLILHYINEIRLYSSFFKLNQVKSNFTKIIGETLNDDKKTFVKIAGQDIHWRIVQRYWGKLDDKSSHPEIFEPHIQPEDLMWRKSEHMLEEIEPQLGWWKELDYIGVPQEGKPITFNLMDNAISYRNRLSYKNRAYYHFKESLWNELFIKYMGEKLLQEIVLKQLDSTDFSPKTIAQSLKKGSRL